jgi:SpoU rRNA methylase family enzyme
LAARLAVSLVAMVDVALLALGVSVALLVLLQETGSKAKQDLPLQLEEVLHDPQNMQLFPATIQQPFFQTSE